MVCSQAIFSIIRFRPSSATPAHTITPQVIPSTPIIASLRERLTAVCETKKKSGPGLISAMICTSATVKKSVNIINSQGNSQDENYIYTFSSG